MTEIEQMRKALAAIAQEARTANYTISLNRDGQGSGRVKVATAMKHIERMAREAITNA